MQEETSCTFFSSFLFSSSSSNLAERLIRTAVWPQGEQLHQAHPLFLCTVVYLHTCALGQHFTVTCDDDHVLCASIQTLRYVPMCTTTYSADALLDSVSVDECSRWSKIVTSMNFRCVCVIVCWFALWICLDVAYVVNIIIGTHKLTSEEIYHHYQKFLLALTLIVILPSLCHCLHAHTQEHGELTHPWNELGIRQSWGGFAAIQTMSYCCEDEDITDPDSYNPQVDRKWGPEAPQRVRDVRCRQEEAWQNLGVVWV